MPKPTIPDLTGTGLTQAAYLDIWTEIIRTTLPAAISFHGCDGDSHATGVEHIALMADAVLAARIARVLQAKEDAMAVREADTPTKSGRGK